MGNTDQRYPKRLRPVKVCYSAMVPGVPPIPSSSSAPRARPIGVERGAVDRRSCKPLTWFRQMKATTGSGPADDSSRGTTCHDGSVWGSQCDGTPWRRPAMSSSSLTTERLLPRRPFSVLPSISSNHKPNPGGRGLPANRRSFFSMVGLFYMVGRQTRPSLLADRNVAQTESAAHPVDAVIEDCIKGAEPNKAAWGQRLG